MNRYIKLSLIATAVALTTACTRIETGEVGVRVGFDKQVKPGELLPGSFNQTLVGDVLTFPVKDVNVTLDNMTPVAKDNSTMKDFDAVVVYNINASQVAELYSTKNKSFHAEFKGDTYVMYNYIVQNARNAIYKSARKYEALDMADNRTEMENYIKDEITRNRAELVGVIDPARMTYNQLIDQGMTEAQALAVLERVVTEQSVMLATNELMLVVSLMLIFSAFVIWLVPKPTRVVDPSASH